MKCHGYNEYFYRPGNMFLVFHLRARNVSSNQLDLRMCLYLGLLIIAWRIYIDINSEADRTTEYLTSVIVKRMQRASKFLLYWRQWGSRRHVISTKVQNNVITFSNRDPCRFLSVGGNRRAVTIAHSDKSHTRSLIQMSRLFPCNVTTFAFYRRRFDLIPVKMSNFY